MGFRYTTGQTPAGAPDEIVAWFAIFEAWVTGQCGWQITSGAGTTDLVIQSYSEAGQMTMLYVHVFRHAVLLNRVYLEVRSGPVVPPANETTSGGFINSAGAQFTYYMAGDKDAIAIVSVTGGGVYRVTYAGLLMPFALNPPDETYRMAAMLDQNNGTILRRFDAAWDQDDNLFENPQYPLSRLDRDDGSQPLGGLYFADHTNIAGEFKHISCRIAPIVGAPLLANITTGPATALTTWIVLQDNNLWHFAMRTGGADPYRGIRTNPTYLGQAGMAAGGYTGLMDVVLAANGWTRRDLSPLTGNLWDIEWGSTGISGNESIFIRTYCPGLLGQIWFRLADMTWGAPGRHESGDFGPGVAQGAVGLQVDVVADPDCCLVGIQQVAGRTSGIYMGMVIPSAQNLSDPQMRSVIIGGAGGVWPGGTIMRAHDGLWLQPATVQPFGDGTVLGDPAANSNPNDYDGQTYVLWPFVVEERLDVEIIGQPKYFYSTDGGGVAHGDSIQCGDTFFHVFENAATFEPWAMQTTGAAVGTLFAGSHLRGQLRRLDEGD